MQFNNKYKFSVDWFSYNIPIWTQALSHLKNKPNLNFLEIGSFQGRSSVWLLENILTDKTSKITCIDTFEGSIEHNIEPQFQLLLPSLYDTFIHNTSYFPNQVFPIKGKSQMILKKLEENFYDFIYIDGDHHASSVLEDAVLSFSLLKKNGIMIFDDYTWGEEFINNRINLHVPKSAINVFLQIYADKIKIIHVDNQVIIEKL